MLRRPFQLLFLVLATSVFMSAANPDVTRDLPRDFGNPEEITGTDWSDDILVTLRDSVVQVILDRASNGNLFCCYRFLGDGEASGWGVAMSTDGGAMWTETACVQFGEVIPDVGMTCIGQFVYVASIQGGGAAVYRLSTTTGLRTPFHSGGLQIYFDSFPDLTEIEVIAGVGVGSSKVRFSLLGNGWLRVKHMDTAAAQSWEWTRKLRDAARGLNTAKNTSGYYSDALMSYIDTLDQLRVYGLRADTGSIVAVYSGSQTTVGDYTSVSGWHDTLIVFFDCQSSNLQARYLTSYNGGTNWYWGLVGDTTASFTRSAAVTGDDGVGQGVVFWQYPQSGHGVSFTWRDYIGSWSTPVSIQDFTSFSTRQNAIEHLGAGQYGIVYFRGTQNGMAYFDRSDWTGVKEERGSGGAVSPPPVPTVARGVLRLRGSSPAVLVDETGRHVTRLAPGANDIRHLSPGIYFTREESSRTTRKVIVTR